MKIYFFQYKNSPNLITINQTRERGKLKTKEKVLEMRIQYGLHLISHDAIEKLDDYIKMIYTHKQQVRDNQESMYWEDDLTRAKWSVRKIKPIAKSFGLYPYNQEKVRNP